MDDKPLEPPEDFLLDEERLLQLEKEMVAEEEERQAEITGNFEAALGALRLLLNREHSFSLERRYRNPDFEKHVRPLVITLEEHLKAQGYQDKDRRRKMRLDILGYICEIPALRTTNDLTLYQCTTINLFLHDPTDWSLAEGAEDFLIYIAGRVGAEGLPAARPDYHKTGRDALPRTSHRPQVPDLW